MRPYSEEEKDQVIRDYFGPPGADDPPRCPVCGEVLEFRRVAQPPYQFTMRIDCPDCQGHFTWHQDQGKQLWKPLHLQYFMERYTSHQTIRCPFDDCYVLYTEFSDGMVEFRCPYCNRRGRVSSPSPKSQGETVLHPGPDPS